MTGIGGDAADCFSGETTVSERYRLTAEIPLNEEYEVIVVGGGPAGCAAATAAARDGAKTLLIEATASLGGMGTNGLIPFWCGFTNGGPICSTGIGRQVLETCRSRMWSGARGDGNNYAIDAEVLKRVYDDLVTEAGAEILFCTVLSAVRTDGNGRVTEIIVSNKAGLTAYRAKVFIDTTGDADLVAWAGGDFVLGDELGEMQAGTLCFTLTGADMDAYRCVKTHRVIYPNPAGEYPLIPDDHCVTAAVGDGAVGFNAGHLIEVNGTDPKSISHNLLLGRRLDEEIVACIKERLPETYGNAYLAKTASVLGVREGRRIVGDYTLTKEDYLARRTFPDEIARNNYNFDSHETKTERKLVAEGKLKPGSNEQFVYAPGESHGIPYRALLPQKLVNVIVAGRSISAERKVMGSIRVMGTCLSTGEAAGVAAAQAVSLPDGNVHRVDTDRLRARLKEVGAYIL